MVSEAPASGRIYFDSFEAALAEFAPPAENRSTVRETVAGLEFARVYLPPSRSYIGLESADARRNVAKVHSGYIEITVARGERRYVELPINKIRAGGGTRVRVAEEAPAVCPRCFVAVPLTGVCVTCDD
ncbi:hypothetical protein [Demequina pelophila]|uniref:hypothetical protein n=1 Tax=Demequina pelophila TaxID=1638984 RepID=UPI000781A76D|nr:hypothetical protein [Demequina pelophila]